MIQEDGLQMGYIAAIAGLFIAAGLALVSKLGTVSNAKLEAEVARARKTENTSVRSNAYLTQFDEAVASYR